MINNVHNFLSVLLEIHESVDSLVSFHILKH